MPSFTRQQCAHILDWLKQLREYISEWVERPLKAELHHASTPAEISSLYTSCQQLKDEIDGCLSRTSLAFTIEEKWLPLIKAALMSSRRLLASGLVVERSKTFHPKLIDSLDAQLKPFDELMKAEWFHKTPALPRPKLSDFIALERVEALLQAKLDPRVYDEKFHILTAPMLLLPDLAYYHDTCGFRGTNVALAYVDIDDFKQFNTKHGETTVDRDLLPKFMTKLEAFVFGRGHAYRYGADEYAVLLPSLDKTTAVATLSALRRHLAGLEYRGIAARTTVSIGLCVMDPECFLTDFEALDKAERAKNHAKAHGKDRIATFSSGFFREEDLCIVDPPEAV